MTEMSDEEFLLYCVTHSETPRCGFVPAQIARLARLSGKPELAADWDALPNEVYNMSPEAICHHVNLARELAAA
jgi:hypothetical protein